MISKKRRSVVGRSQRPSRVRRTLFVLVLLGGCRSISDRGAGGASSHGATETERSALTASTTLAQAVAGKIVPITGAPSNLISDAVPGDPSVGADGSAAYGFPIWVPAGINGLQPNLTVEYNSTAPSGLLGPRWRISGLSSIVRCTKTLAQDGVQSVVDWVKGDTFCLDGQRLIRLNSTSSQFFTEQESYNKIIGQMNNAGQWSSFIEYKRDGRIFYYGETPSATLHGQPNGQAQPDSTYAYYLDRIVDRYGNAITFTYNNSNSNSSSGLATVQELQPATITWGATQQRSVTFNYNPLPPGVTVNPLMHWVHGLGIGVGTTVSGIVVKGPDGSGGAPVVLKQYKFGYSNSPSTDTGNWLPGLTNSVLSTISECDAANVCKKATTFKWSGGANSHTLVNYGITDAAFGNASYPAPITKGTVNVAIDYERIMAVDLDNDGLDDVVYRNYATPHHAGFYDCVGWLARLGSVNSAGTPSFGAATALQKLGGDPDPSCRSYLTSSTAYKTVVGGSAYPGDLLFADVNGDGFIDLLSPIGRALGTSTPLTSAQTVGFRAYINGGAGPGTFGNPIDFLDSSTQLPAQASFSSLKSTLVGIGDLNGDGFLEIVRPTENPPQHLQGATLIPSSLESESQVADGMTFPYQVCNAVGNCNQVIPDVSQTLTNISLVDLDGDGTAEVLRNYQPCSNLSACQPGVTSVTSPTMNTQIMLAPADATTSTGTYPTRWFLDLNGDGLLDVAWLAATPGVSNSYTIYTAMNNGTAFVSPKGTTSIAPISNPAVLQPMVVDYNLDGRQDLVLNSPSTVLLSDGEGSFVGTALNGVPAANYNAATQRAERQIADLNGDGLPDILQLEGTSPNITLKGYISTGGAPELVIQIVEGTGRNINFTYDVPTAKDSTFYTSNSAQSCGTDPQHLACLNRGRWLTRSLVVTDSGATGSSTQTFAYTNGVMDKHGRGFLGFTQRDIYGPGTQHVSITYNPTYRMLGSGNNYAYPYALGMPTYVSVDTNTNQGSDPHHFEYTSAVYNVGWTSNGTYTITPSNIYNYRYDCPTINGKTCNPSGTSRLLSTTTEQLAFDAYGNLTSLTSNPSDQNGSLGVETETHHYAPPNTSAWLNNLPDPAHPDTVTSTSASGESVTRTTVYTADTVHGGLISIEREPAGSADQHLIRTFNRDASTGKMLSITDTAPGTGEARTTKFTYEDPDNVYIGTVTDPVGHPHTVWRHPGLGLVVETDDPNGLAATATYDTFGRPLSRTAGNGASVVYSYQDSPTGSGANATIIPEGKSTRAITVQYDSAGRETSRTSPIDGVATRTETHLYDGIGRLAQRTLHRGSQGTDTIFNTYSYGYDDLDRPLSVCHVSSDGGTHCTSNSYDGLTLTATDESGEVTTNIVDGKGRPSIQRAALQTGTTDTAFTYGPFDVLEDESVSDGSGSTSFLYDVLGRQALFFRRNSGQRTTAYNAFGDVVQRGKVDDHQSAADTLVYSRDAIGRATSLTATNSISGSVTRKFYWDAPYQTPNVTEANAIGKLVDVFDGQNQVHYDYDPNGEVHEETWTLSLFGQPATTQGASIFYYDSQGRPQWVIYPSIVNAGNDELELFYTYDQYTGTTASVADGNFLSNPLWTATSRNTFGEVVGETLRPESLNTLLKTNLYNAQDGMLSTSTLLGDNGEIQELYTYQANGLPATFGVSSPEGITSGWTASFGYDNLSRLTTWQGAGGAPTVTYQYDGDGNVLSRSWPGGDSVSYARTPLSLTKTVTPAGGTAQTYTYQSDFWGRTYNTPAVSLSYNAADEITSVVETANGNQADTIIHDGLGNKVATTYGNGDYLLTLMEGRYEYNYTAATGAKTERCRMIVDGKAIGDVITSNTANRSATFYLTDNQGSVVAEGNSAGTVTARSQRDPYGNLVTNPTSPSLPADVAGTNPDGTSTFGYGDHDRLTNWGLVDMNARLYSPSIGQFISPDPVIANPFDRRSYNPFVYVWDSPTVMRDPTGLCGDGQGDCPDGNGDGSGSWIPNSWGDIEHLFGGIIGKDFFGDIVGKDFGGKIIGHDVGRVFFGRYIGEDFFGHDVPSAVKTVAHYIKAAYEYFFGSSPPPVPVPTAQTASTSTNGTATANAGTQTAGTTENTNGEGPEASKGQVNGPPWVSVAQGELGTRMPDALDYFSATNYRDPKVTTHWCSAFCNWVMKQSGITGTNSARALDWLNLNWGQSLGVDNPAVGAIGVIDWDGTYGHVGLVVGQTPSGDIVLLGGNQSGRVQYSAYPIGDFSDFLYPNGYWPADDDWGPLPIVNPKWLNQQIGK